VTSARSAGEPVFEGQTRAWRAVENAVLGTSREIAEVDVSGPRAAQAAMTALVVAITVGIACAMHVPEVWWAALAGYMSTQATRPASLQKGLLRIVGTAAGAALSLALADWLVYDVVAACLALFVVSTIGILGVSVSSHGYAWLFFSITFSLVLLLSISDPAGAFNFAAYRTIEVTIGTSVAIVVAYALAPEAPPGGDPAPPGWTDLFGAQWPILRHAMRAGIGVALIPLLWSHFYVAGLTPTAMMLSCIIAIPVLSFHPLDPDGTMVENAMHRLIGCILGGIAALVLLALPLTAFVPWLLALAVGTWLFSFVQQSARGVGYVGTQAAIVFMVTLVQGNGPSAGILPGIDRFAGITIGLVTLLIVSLLLAPVSQGPAPPPMRSR